MYLVLRALRALFTLGGAINAPLTKQVRRKPTGPFAIGERVIIVDNEETPYFIATIAGYKEVGRMGNVLPLIKDGDGIKYLCMSIIRPFNEELTNILDTLSPIEQWNYLAHDHSQLKEKNGIDQRTFKCACAECALRRLRYISND